MTREISNMDLSEKDIPSLQEDNLMEIWSFALTFDGYSIADLSSLQNLNKRVINKFSRYKRINEDVTLAELRACLFLTQREWRWNGEGLLNEKERAYINALIKGIKDRLRAGKRN
jgi:hypothetical protein